MSCDMWFGTQEYATWIPTPLRGADVSAHGWNENGTFLNGGAYAFNSYNTHKEFDFSWRSTSSRKEAQTMMSFYSGTFGRGKLYFLDPLTMKTNVLPARWADPSITCDFEGESLVPGVDPLRVSQTNTDRLQLPVTAAQYDLSGITEVETSFNAEATNLFTNPNLVGDGTWAEVRRNLVRNPLAVGVGDYESNNGADSAMTLDSRPNNGPFGTTQMIRGTRIGAGNAWSYIQMSGHGSGQRPTVTPGQWVAMRARVWASLESVVSGIQFRNDTTFVSQVGSPAVTVTNSGHDGTWVEFSAQVPEGVTHANFTVGYATGQTGNTAGAWVQVATPMVVQAGSQEDALRQAREFFAPGIGAGVSGLAQPEDFRVRWLGEENASESVMDIERVRGLTSSRCIAGVSTQGGKPAVRLIAITPDTQASDAWSYAYFSIPAEARASGTAVGTRTQIAAFAGTHSSYKSLRVDAPALSTSVEPNSAGEKSLRLNYADLTGTFRVSLGHGGTAASGSDVWWTDIGLFAGDYDGPAFSGDSEVPGKVTRWTGTPNDSPSEIGHLTLSTPSAISDSNALFVPLPDGMQLNIGAFYQSTTAGQGVYVTPATRGGGNTGVVTRLLPITSSAADTLPNTFTKTPGVIGVWVWIGKTAQGPGVVTVNALHARVSPLGSTSTGEAHWYGGQGNEGVRFLQPPTYINNTGVDGGQVEFAATFTEVAF